MRTAKSSQSSLLLLSAMLPLSLAACASGTAGEAGSAATVADAAPFTLRPGERAVLADASSLQYVRLVNDSRCAPDVQCVWAGDAIVAFLWTPANGTAQEFELHTGLEPRSRAIGARMLTLKALARGAQPQATLQVDAGS
jgi:hypothetical protein